MLQDRLQKVVSVNCRLATVVNYRQPSPPDETFFLRRGRTTEYEECLRTAFTSAVEREREREIDRKKEREREGESET